MSLYDKILKIQYDNNINATEFIEKTGFSRSLYYSIKEDDSKVLKPKQVNKIISVFKNVSKEWLLSETTQKENKKDNYSEESKTNNQLINYSELPDEVIEYEFVRRFETIKERPIIKRVLKSEIEVSVAKRVVEITKDKNSFNAYLNS